MHLATQQVREDGALLRLGGHTRRIQYRDPTPGPAWLVLRPEAVRETETALDVEVPIVSVTRETLRDRIAELAADAGRRNAVGAASRAYVEQVHDADKGADRLVEIYGAL